MTPTLQISTYECELEGCIGTDGGCRAGLKALRRKVPIGANALGGEFDVAFVFLNDFREAKVADLDLALVEEDVLGLEVLQFKRRVLHSG